MNSNLIPRTAPFDAIRKVDERGQEFWSARELAPLLGYFRWERFDDAVERARAAVENVGQSADDHLRDASKMVEIGSGAIRYVGDFHLTRYGAYVVAMNGDPRKAEVAAAQTYFAVKTREAELAPVAPDLSTPAGVVAMAEQFLATARALAESQERVAFLEPRAQVADELLDATGDMSVADAAKALARSGAQIGSGRLFQVLHDLGWIYRGGDSRWHVKQTAIETGRMAALPQSHYHPGTGERVIDAPQPRVTPKGIEYLLRHLSQRHLVAVGS